MKKEVQLTVEGKVFRPNRKKVLALNRCLEEYSGAVEWYLNFNSTSKTFLHKNGYERAKQLFNLNTALIQTARDKAVRDSKELQPKKREKAKSSQIDQH
ncbi:hypothetical protein [Archaeoglobus sp.]